MKKKNVVLEIIRHFMLPLGLMASMNYIAPLFVIRLFAGDIWLVTVICTCLLLLSGLYKLGYVICKRIRIRNDKAGVAML